MMPSAVIYKLTNLDNMKTELLKPHSVCVSTGEVAISSDSFADMHEYLMALAYRYVGGSSTREDRRDIVQEVLLDFHLRCEDGRYDITISSPKTYLTKAMWYACLNWLREKSKRPLLQELPYTATAEDDDDCSCTVVLSEDLFRVTPEIFADTPEAVAARRSKAIREIMEQHLAPRERLAFQLYLDGQSSKVIAEKLGISLETTVNVYLYRIREKIKRLLPMSNVA